MKHKPCSLLILLLHIRRIATIEVLTNVPIFVDIPKRLKYHKQKS